MTSRYNGTSTLKSQSTSLPHYPLKRPAFGCGYVKRANKKINNNNN